MIISDKSKNIFYRKWSAGEAGAVFLLVHGLGGHSERWEEFAKFFLFYNIHCYALELKGFGETEDLKGYVRSFEQYYNDILTLRQIIKNDNPNKKIFLCGESLGGLLAFAVACRYDDFFDGLVCISPVFADRLKVPAAEYLRLFLSILFNPRKQFIVPFDSVMLTRDRDCREKLDSDPREHRFATGRMIANIFNLQAKTKSSKNRTNAPVLFLLAGNDEVVVNADSQKVFQRLSAADKAIIEYSGACHALSIDSERQKVFKDILEWIKKRM